MSEGSKNLSFEIPFVDTPKSSTGRSPLSLKRQSRSEEISKKDVIEKLEEADRRRSEILQQTREKNEAHIQKVKSVVEENKAKKEEQRAEIMEKLELADLRRRQKLEGKVESAKKIVDRVERVRASVSEETEKIAQELAQDMANKENNRRMIIKSVQDSCQQQLEKVAEVKIRRASLRKSDSVEQE